MNLPGVLAGLLAAVAVAYTCVYLGLCLAALRADAAGEDERASSLRLRAFGLRLGVRALLVAALFVTLAVALL